MAAAGSPAEPVTDLIEFREFETRSSAANAAADLLAKLVRKALSASLEAEASLVVSGGSTPGPCFDLLSGEGLDWSRVTVVPSDERWVPATDPDSNERLIRTRLLTDRAESGNLLSFFHTGLDASQALMQIAKNLGTLAQPFSATLLGMGEDGHFASLFPDFDGLEKALDPLNPLACILVKTAGSPHLRISLTLSALLNSAQIVLLIFGETKRAVFEAAKTGGSNYPIEVLLVNARTPLTVFWAP